MLPGAAPRASEPRHRRAGARTLLVLTLALLGLVLWTGRRDAGPLREEPAPALPQIADRTDLTTPARPTDAGCLDCHRDLQQQLALASMRPGHRRSRPEADGPGAIDCESCHGEGQAHAESARLGGRPLAVAFHPSHSLPGEELRMCGRCHGGPVGDSSSDAKPRAPHPLTLTDSRCYQASAGRLSCTTCHDPHRSDGEDRARYERVCLDCHRPQEQRPEVVSCPVAPRSGCIECHLPMVPAGGSRLVTDHQIRVPAGSKRR